MGKFDPLKFFSQAKDDFFNKEEQIFKEDFICDRPLKVENK